VNGFGSYSPLAKAAEKGLTEAIKCLLDAGANPNVPDTVRYASCCMHHYSDLLDFISSIALSNAHMQCWHDVMCKHDAMQKCSYDSTRFMCY